MKTEPLIDTLVDELEPIRSRKVIGGAWLLLLVVMIELALYWPLGIGREHLREATTSMPAFLWKLFSLAFLSALSATVALSTTDPTRSAWRGLRAIPAALAFIMLVGWLLDAHITRHALPLWTRLNPADGVECMLSIVTLSIPPIATLALLLRRGAPTDLRGSGLSAGIAGGAIGAFLFVFACPHSDPIYTMIWFALACTVVAIVGRLTLPLIIRW